ncbi:complex I intermediate-associated protein 30 (CIA30) domain-containing protein [Hirsutella rhossiliensis]|uniref:Complex I intermediate-associated protein 30 (CIA30) domain-containing protein n=1 Tax=Hirsutella rhossiliensis TaxID=111463 RepID=A0A9P8N010_9HYPO|nr:complex I intermediate-associated protein 30 (CIA30) domain-containing protein [Hirsutella rhossiliensis]KAH0964359.1 complex I intermediate-associated protein 30 (CIA30) domain-containing protein [Hirsutella rhossiliensis]
MNATRPLLARGFLARSIDELKRRSSIAWKLEAVKGPQGSRPLYDFRDQDSVRDCILMSDHLIGGSSQSSLDFVSSAASEDAPSPPTSSESHSPPTSYARFQGLISTSLPADRPNIQRSGYAAFRTPDQAPTVFGRSMWDIDPYTYLAMRIKSDGRAYFINLQTEAVEPTDLHQHRLFAKRPGQWETVMVKWNDFVRTNYGFVVEPQTELLRQKVRSVGVGLTDRIEGPFELCIERVWATNQVTEGATVIKSEKSQLKNRRGERIQW